MKKQIMRFCKSGGMHVLLAFLFTTSGFSQTITIKGNVSEKAGNPLISANVVLEGTNLGASTDREGNYTIKNVPIGNYTLAFHYIGYRTKKEEISVSTSDMQVNAQLEMDALNVDAIVVTGVFDERTKMESSVAISVLSPKELKMRMPASAAELLKNIPGVYVNSSLGEIRNTVYSRGVSVGSNDGASGFYYVSMQEDGLPVTNATYNNYGPDYFLRQDITLERLEAVKGGTASILGNNAPGGIFNYVTKIGGMEFDAEARVKYGLEGNGKNPYYRLDAGFGGPLSIEHNMTYYVGGFFRQSDGARYPGYPMNNGGQIKGNINKYYDNGSVMLYAKYLNDKNAWFEFLPTVGFTDPKLPTGVEQTNSVLIPAVKNEFYVNDTNEKKEYDSEDKIHSKDFSVGLNLDHSFGNGWKLDNKARISNKSALWNTTAVVYPFAVDNFIWYAVSGNLGRMGTYSFQDRSGRELASVTQAFDPTAPPYLPPFSFTVNHSELPGEAIQPNSLFFNPLNYSENDVNEVMNQFKISKKLDNMSFTAGGFYGYTDAYWLNTQSTGVIYSQMTSPRPEPTMITLTDFDGQVYQVTNPDAIASGADGAHAAVNESNASQSDLALFFGHNWEISELLNLDWGIRYETIKIKGTNDIAQNIDPGTGGTDGDLLTLYDNMVGQVTDHYDYDETVNTFSFSAGSNYKLNENNAIYGRYSLGEKAPDMTTYLFINSPASALSLNPIAQKIQQIEFGYKTRQDAFTLFVTPFYSILSNVPSQSVGQETDDLSSVYATSVLYNKFNSMGVELEGNYAITSNFAVRAVATFQKSEAVDYRTWIMGQNGSADDTIEDFSGNDTDNQANAIIRITPSYQAKNFFVAVDWTYMGERAANVPNAFSLPSYNMTHLNAGYNITPKVQLQLNINNIFNQNGIMGWSAPGGFPAALNRQGFTKEMLEANPNVVYSTLSLPPRAAFMTVNYKF
ncbi:MAG: TonB-dependent receptor [Deferribacteres bacterium]|nr:TonB-dependent receptor [Deferribacteres bacterium]